MVRTILQLYKSDWGGGGRGCWGREKTSKQYLIHSKEGEWKKMLCKEEVNKKIPVE